MTRVAVLKGGMSSEREIVRARNFSRYGRSLRAGSERSGL